MLPIERLKLIVAANLELSEEIVIGNDENLIEEYLMDSLSFIGIVVELEDNFNFEFNYDDLSLENFSTVSKIVGSMSKYPAFEGRVIQ